MLGGEVVAARGAGRVVGDADAALRCDEDLFAEARVFAHDLAEGALGAALAIDVRVIKKRVAGLDRGRGPRRGRS